MLNWNVAKKKKKTKKRKLGRKIKWQTEQKQKKFNRRYWVPWVGVGDAEKLTIGRYDRRFISPAQTLKKMITINQLLASSSPILTRLS